MRIVALLAFASAGCAGGVAPLSADAAGEALAASLRADGLTVSDERVKDDVALADPSECLDKVARLELRHFTYRSKQFYNRMFSPRQLGVLAQQARGVIPGAVGVVKEMPVSSSPRVALPANASTVPQIAGRTPAVLENFHVIDANVLFMHNLGATQRLLQLHTQLKESVSGISSSVDGLAGTTGALLQLESSLEQLRNSQLNESTKQVIERRRIAEASAKEVTARIDIERIKAEERRSSQKHETERDAKLAERDAMLAKAQEDASVKRIANEDATARTRNAQLVQLQEESAARQEEIRVANEQALIAAKHAMAMEQVASERLTEIEKEKVAANARIKQERENEDILLRRAAQAHEAARQRAMEQLREGVALLKKGATEFLTSPRQMATVGGSVALLIGSMILLRELAKVLGNYLAVLLGRPSLIRQSSKVGVCAAVPRFAWSVVLFCLRIIFFLCWRKAKVDPLKGIVLESTLEERIGAISTSVRNARTNRAPLRHFLFYGPPGTGKTLVARRLADVCGLGTLGRLRATNRCCALKRAPSTHPTERIFFLSFSVSGSPLSPPLVADYAIMSGGDVIPLGKDAVTELHSLFSWASRSKKGLLLFIDEADAFLASRATKRGQSDDLRNAITALLYHTGSPTPNLMLVRRVAFYSMRPCCHLLQHSACPGTYRNAPAPSALSRPPLVYSPSPPLPMSTHYKVLASNRPGDLDAAVADRIDEAIEFDLPGAAARQRLVRLYFKTHVEAHSNRNAQKRRSCRGGAMIQLNDDVSDDVLGDIADRTENFSGREISKLWLAVQSYVYGSAECSLDAAKLEVLIVRIIDEQKKKWALLADKVAWS